MLHAAIQKISKLKQEVGPLLSHAAVMLHCAAPLRRRRTNPWPCAGNVAFTMSKSPAVAACAALARQAAHRLTDENDAPSPDFSSSDIRAVCKFNDSKNRECAWGESRGNASSHIRGRHPGQSPGSRVTNAGERGSGFWAAPRMTKTENDPSLPSPFRGGRKE